MGYIIVKPISGEIISFAKERPTQQSAYLYIPQEYSDYVTRLLFYEKGEWKYDAYERRFVHIDGYPLSALLEPAPQDFVVLDHVQIANTLASSYSTYRDIPDVCERFFPEFIGQNPSIADDFIINNVSPSHPEYKRECLRFYRKSLDIAGVSSIYWAAYWWPFSTAIWAYGQLSNQDFLQFQSQVGNKSRIIDHLYHKGLSLNVPQGIK